MAQSRRTLLGASVALAAVGAAPAAAALPPNTDAALVAAAADYARLWDEYGAICLALDKVPAGVEQPEQDALLDARLDVIGERMDGLEDRLCLLPARTPAGLRAKAEVLSCRMMPWDVPLATSLVRDLLGRE